jgi:uridine phosphorylase
LADDDHGPLALQEILLAGCPTVGDCTGASRVRHGSTGALVERLPPGRKCVASDADEAALMASLEAVRRVRGMDRKGIRAAAAADFDTEHIIDVLLAALHRASAPAG